MSSEHSPASQHLRGHNGEPPLDDDAKRGAFDAADYWYALIDEIEGGKFVGLDRRSMQKLRQVGGGPEFIRISSRCVRYRRIDLRRWAEARLRRSTSDPGPQPVAA